jgi:molybdenum cofactor synthesis domain-containing protein
VNGKADCNNTKSFVTAQVISSNSLDQSSSNHSSNEIIQSQKSADDVSIVSSTTTTISQRSVGLLIIGDEILKGLTPDKNTHTAASALKANNVPLTKVSVVSDDLDDIVSEIEYLSSIVDIIITSGGVGPTHDDVTIKSVGKALGSEMTFNEKMAELLRSKMNNGDEGGDGKEEKQLTEAQIKMATLPKCSKLRYLSNDENDWPVLQCKNIFILPGVPQFFEKKVDLVASYLSTELERTVAYKVVLSIDENSIVSILNNVVSNHPNVSFGSYPFVDHPDFKTVVTLEGRRFEGGAKHNSSRFLSISGLDDDDDHDFGPREFEKKDVDLNVKLALADLVNELPLGSILRVDNDNDLTFN